MDATLGAGILGAAAALLGALIGGICTLVGAERALRTALLAESVRQQGLHVAALRAAKRELDANTLLIEQVGGLPIWVPLQRTALDGFLGGAGGGIPDPVIEAAAAITRYNALVDASRAYLVSKQPMPPKLELQLTQLCAEIIPILEAAATAIEQSAFGIETWATPAQRILQQLDKAPWYRRLWVLLTNPHLLPPPPP